MKRFASAAAIALPVTVALLFLMTRLILPGEHDRVVARMIQNIEFQRAVRPPDPVGVLVYEKPKSIAEKPARSEPNLAVSTQARNSIDDETSIDVTEATTRGEKIDWWAEARRIVQDTNEAALRRWLLEQGYEPYVSIMQGPLPISNSVHGTLPDTQEDETGYLNTYGDMEIKISENCVATTQVAARFDHSDFGKALPMRITCKSPAKQKFSFERE